MHSYHFKLVVAGKKTLTRNLAERIFAAGCDDGTAHSRDGIVAVSFTREAKSLETAIRSAVGQLQKAGLAVARVELAPELLEA